MLECKILTSVLDIRPWKLF